MNPRWLYATAYLLMAAAWLYHGLLAFNNEHAFHIVVPLVQAGLALVCLVASLMLPSMGSLFIHWIGAALLACASVVLTVYNFNENRIYWTVHAAQTAGLLVAAWYVIQWWLSTGGHKHARKLAAGYLLASLGALAMIGLEFIGQGHPLQTAQRPYAAAADGLLALAFLLAAWMGGASASTLKTPEAVVEPD